MSHEEEFQEAKLSLKEEIKDTLRDIEEHRKELEIILSVSDKFGDDPSKMEFIKAVTKDAIDDAKSTIAHFEKLIKSAKLLKNKPLYVTVRYTWEHQKKILESGSSKAKSKVRLT